MAIEGIVTQTGDGKVIKCSAMSICRANNTMIKENEIKTKRCQLNVDHGDRCLAYPQDTSTWLISEDPNQIRQIPTFDKDKI
jgi:hypothetical protein